MLLHLNAINNEMDTTNIAIKEMSDDRNSWISVTSHIHAVDEKQFSQFIDYLCSHFSPNDIKFYLGYYGEIPVTTVLTINHEGIVGIYGVETLSAYRRKGIGYATSKHALLCAKEAGAQKAILLATDKGKSLYKKIGFQEYAQCKAYSYMGLL